jgi:hypothetical protein
MTITEEIALLKKLFRSKGECIGINILSCDVCFVSKKLDKDKSCPSNKNVMLLAKERMLELKEQIEKLKYLEQLQHDKPR